MFVIDGVNATSLQEVTYCFGLLGTAAFAVTGVLVAGRLRMDAFGVLVLASVTAIGGGTLRDLILGVRPVFWIADPNYLRVIWTTALLAMLLARLPKRWPRRLLPITDAVGLAIFTVAGVEKALAVGVPDIVAVVMGVISGVAGGMMRDMLAGKVPLVLRREIYATACIFGGVLYIGTLALGMPAFMSGVMGMAGTFLLRAAALRWSLSLPAFSLR